MESKTAIHTFKLSGGEYNEELEMSISSEVPIDKFLEFVKAYMLASGYIIDPMSSLDFVLNETECCGGGCGCHD
jgi:DNA-binding transcriptional regulator WhiA